MKENETFKSNYEKDVWRMFSYQFIDDDEKFEYNANPYLAQELVRERNAQREKQEERTL